MTDPTTLPRCDESAEERPSETYARKRRGARSTLDWEGPPVSGVWLDADGVLHNDSKQEILFTFGRSVSMIVAKAGGEVGAPAPPGSTISVEETIVEPTRLGLALVRLRRALLRWLE